ncbi:MAG: transposase [Anaerolineaceae bacterium]|nr:transposase [Anaerolineaceae bacterium]
MNPMVKQDRKATRLNGYDYSQPGAYFVTICVKNRECALGTIIDGFVHLSHEGKFVSDAWINLPRHYQHANLDEFVVMPNHVHGIIIIVGEGLVEQYSPNVQLHRPSPTGVSGRHGLSEIVRAFKSFSARRINRYRGTTGTPFWQRTFYDRIIRDEDELNRAQEYIMDNPIKRELDSEKPHA